MPKPQKPKRKRAIPYIYSNPRLDELLEQLLQDRDWRLRLYAYRLEDDQKILPAIYAGRPFSDLEDWLRDEHGGGDFHIIIRRGKKMTLSGAIGIGVPLAQQAR